MPDFEAFGALRELDLDDKSQSISKPLTLIYVIHNIGPARASASYRKGFLCVNYWLVEVSYSRYWSLR